LRDGTLADNFVLNFANHVEQLALAKSHAPTQTPQFLRREFPAIGEGKDGRKGIFRFFTRIAAPAC